MELFLSTSTGRLVLTMESHTQGQRLRAVREMMRYTRKEFADLIGTNEARLRNIETNHQKMTAVDFEDMGRVMPWALHFVTYGGPLELFMPDSPDPEHLRRISEVFRELESEAGKVLIAPESDKHQNNQYDEFLETLAKSMKDKGLI